MSCVGNCWRALPLEEKRVWEIKAKHAKAEHKARYPEYRFRPVHNKNKEKKKEKATPTAEDERRCEEVAQLLLDGMKGDQLAAAIRKLDEDKVHVPPPTYLLRRPSSVPLPDSRFGATGITIPTLPFFAGSRPGSPVGKISHSARYILGQRRASSAQPSIPRYWGVAPPTSWQRDESPLPEADTSLFEPSFFNSNFSSQPMQSDSAFVRIPFFSC
jgi:transcription factor SOX7/8/10/18 (SOX group E/F)